MELEMRSVEPGDMKSVMVDEMSIRWSAIRSSAEEAQVRGAEKAPAVTDCDGQLTKGRTN